MNFKTWIISTAFLAAVGLVFSVVPSFADDSLSFNGYFRQGICVKDDGSRPANVSTFPDHSTNLPGIGRVGNECDQDIRLTFKKALIKPREEGGPGWDIIVNFGNWSTTDDEVWPTDGQPTGNDHTRTARLMMDNIYIEATNVLGSDSSLIVGMIGRKPPGDNHLHDYFWFDEGGDGVSYEKKLDMGILTLNWFRMGGGQNWTGGTFAKDDLIAWGGYNSGALTGSYYSVWMRDIKPADDVTLRFRYGMGSNPGGKAGKIQPGWAGFDVMEYDAVSGNIMTGVIQFKAGIGHSILVEQRTGNLACTHKNPVKGDCPGVTGFYADADDVMGKSKFRLDYGTGYNFGKFHTILNFMHETEDDSEADDAALTWQSVVARGQYHVNKVISYVVEAGRESLDKDAWEDAKISAKYTGGVVVSADPGWGPSMWVRPIFRFTASQFSNEQGDNDDDYMQYTAFVESWF